LSFIEYTEAERTKHVHRLHPYKGKFIPQLVEYFLDSHVDEYKKEVYFQPGDIVLDPFCGSGTTLVQANELNEHALGIDISSFNSLVTNIKVRKHDLKHLSTEINRISQTLSEFNSKRNIKAFESKLLFELAKFNSKYFPSPSYKKQIREGLINEFEYSRTKELEFLDTFNTLIKKLSDFKSSSRLKLIFGEMVPSLSFGGNRNSQG